MPSKCSWSLWWETFAVGLFSASRHTSFMVLTAFTGCAPTAVSAESITASVPSKTAFATSKTSALVGIGLVIIDSSICVAVITNLSFALANKIKRFCWAGN